MGIIAVAKSIVVPLCIRLRVTSKIHEQLQSATAGYRMLYYFICFSECNRVLMCKNAKMLRH
jgi:hypothetical protein